MIVRTPRSVRTDDVLTHLDRLHVTVTLDTETILQHTPAKVLLFFI